MVQECTGRSAYVCIVFQAATQGWGDNEDQPMAHLVSDAVGEADGVCGAEGALEADAVGLGDHSRQVAGL
eukprot:scaffold267380_cov25-Prasinocladus_malaysianus.AAC.2